MAPIFPSILPKVPARHSGIYLWRAVQAAALFAFAVGLSAQAPPQVFEDAKDPTTRLNAAAPGPDVVRERWVSTRLESFTSGPLDPSRRPRSRAESGPRRLRLNLFPDADAIFTQTERRETADGVIWKGRSESGGEALVLVRAGSITANVRLGDGRFFHVRSGPGVDSPDVIREVVFQRSGFIDDAVEPPDLPQPAALRPQPVRANPEPIAQSTSTIDVVVAYSPSARQARGGQTAIENLIQLTIAETNSGYGRSGVGAQMRLVHMQELAPGASEAANIGFLNHITSGLSSLRSLRDQHGADLVSYWIDGPGSNGGVVGIAWLMTNPSSSFASRGFSVVESRFASGPAYTFAHETGHNMGANHDWDVSGNPGAFDYSHAHKDETGSSPFHTVMAYQCNNAPCTAINNWSNPSVNFQGRPTGIAAGQTRAADNARTLNSTRSIVAAFRSASGGGGNTGGPQNREPSAVSIAPNSGSGGSETFTLTYSDPDGINDLAFVHWLLNTSLAYGGSCGVRYSPVTGQFNLVNEAGSAWQSPATVGTVSNSRYSVDLSATQTQSSGSTLTLSLPVEFTAAFAGAKFAWIQAEDKSDDDSGWQQLGAWTVPSSTPRGGGGGTNPPPYGTAPSAGQITPSSGDSATQEFSMTFSDPDGAGDIENAYFLANTTATWPGACGLRYSRSTNQLRIGTDSASGWAGALNPGSGSIENSECSVDGDSVEVTDAGNQLTLTMEVAFKDSFGGARGLFLSAEDSQGNSTEWKSVGSWSVPGSGGGGGGTGGTDPGCANPTNPFGGCGGTGGTGGTGGPGGGGSTPGCTNPFSGCGGGGAAPQAPTPASVKPSSGRGGRQDFSFQFSDGNGTADMRRVFFVFTHNESWRDACGLRYTLAEDLLEIARDDGSGLSSGLHPGSSSIGNSQCSIDGSTVEVSLDGNELTINLSIAFKASFTGPKKTLLLIEDRGNLSSGWRELGEWTVDLTVAPGGNTPSQPGPPRAEADLPASGRGDQATLTLRFSDNEGAEGITHAYWIFNGSLRWASGCNFFYDPQDGVLGLANDTGNEWVGTITPGGGVLENRQCSVDGRSVSVDRSGDTLALTLTLNFTPYFSGPKNIFAVAGDGGSQASGWEHIGSWYVEGPAVASPPAGPIPEGVSPADGTGSAASLVFTYSGADGVEDLDVVFGWINSDLVSNGGCIFSYQPATGEFSLVNDIGDGWLAPVALGEGAVANSQCAISGAASSVGDRIQLDLDFNFANAFSGTKKIYMIAIDKCDALSAWVDAGTWNVP